MAQDEAQRRLGHVVRADAEVGADRRDTPLDLGGAVVAEVAVAEVALGEGRAGRDPPGQSALVEGDAHDDADAVLRAGGEQVLGRGLVEDVVDDLDGVDRAAAHQPDGVVGLVVVDRHAEEADLALALQVLDRLQPLAAADPFVAPHVELHHVEVVEAARAQTGLETVADALAGEGLPGVYPVRGGPQPVQRRHLGGHEDLVTGPLPHHPADDALALAVAAGGVDEVHAEVQGPVQRTDGLVLARAEPGGLADAPGAVADLRHGQSAASQFATAHGAPLRHGDPRGADDPPTGRCRRLRRP